MKRTVRKVALSAEILCVGDPGVLPRCDWRRSYVGVRSERSARAAAERHKKRDGHGSMITVEYENVYSSWPDRHDIQAWGLAEFEDERGHVAEATT